MARITIEDCMEHVPNRFHLVRMASIRAKQLKKGARPLLTSEENKEVVMSLREIAAGLVKPGELAVDPEAGFEAPGQVDPLATASTAEGEEMAASSAASISTPGDVPATPESVPGD